MNEQPTNPDRADRQRPPVDPAQQPVVDSQDLLRDRRELRIRHAGELYVLRVTRNGRLILNK